jgi:hypothetical protein
VHKARPTVFEHNKQAEVSEENGSAESLFEWANAARLDARKKRNFEYIKASFILTFHSFNED